MSLMQTQLKSQALSAQCVKEGRKLTPMTVEKPLSYMNHGN